MVWYLMISYHSIACSVQFICAQCGGSREVSAPGWLSNDHQVTQNQFSGAFQNSIQKFWFYFLFPPLFSYISNTKSKHLANKVSQDDILLWFKQWPKGLPGRRRLQHHQVAIYMCHILYVFAYVTLIKSTHSLTHLFDFSPLCVFKYDIKSTAREIA